MSGPFLPPRAAQPLDLLVDNAGEGGWEELERIMTAQPGGAALQPADAVAVFMFGLYTVPQGRAMFEWMMDVSIRQPLRITGKSIEETALLMAGRQGVNGFAEAVLAAIKLGEELATERRKTTGAGS